MKPQKSWMIIIWACMILLSSITVSAYKKADSPHDVLHRVGSDWNDWEWDVLYKPNIEIIEIKYSAGEALVVEMMIKGIFNRNNSNYNIWYNTSDAWYHVSYIPGDDSEPSAVAFPKNYDTWTEEEKLNWTAPETQVNIIDSSYLVAAFEWITDDHNATEFYTWAKEWDDTQENMTEFWIDYAPNDYSPYGEYDDYFGNNDTIPKDKDTPGFELIVVIAASFIAVLFLRTVPPNAKK